MTLGRAFLCSVRFMLECHLYALYAKCYDAECLYAEYHGAVLNGREEEKVYQCSNLKPRLISSLNKQKKRRLKMKCLLT
jgi:hypothetical protein